MPRAPARPGRRSRPVMLRSRHGRSSNGVGPARCVRTPGFALTTQAVRDTHRITMTGEFTMVTTELLDGAVADLCRRRAPGRPARALVLDLTDVTFLDVMGVTSLQRAYERAYRRGGVRVGLPIGTGPKRLIEVAVDHGWLSAAFLPSTPTW